ncbi:Uncharacterized protein TCM_014004 [Theobroma cacao]|uniref:Uncharacterized protein n=1 Tax=Theobroma cacao TaxID=3641 RepID=A0A061FY99_THECC|nr:Uncharacterized protein TCM_014004 [Theobroma cacao]
MCESLVKAEQLDSLSGKLGSGDVWCGRSYAREDSCSEVQFQGADRRVDGYGYYFWSNQVDRHYWIVMCLANAASLRFLLHPAS